MPNGGGRRRLSGESDNAVLVVAIRRRACYGFDYTGLTAAAFTIPGFCRGAAVVGLFLYHSGGNQQCVTFGF